MKWNLIAILAIVAVIAGTATLVLGVGLRGIVSVPSRVFDIDLIVDRDSGEAFYSLGRVEIPDGNVMVKVILVEHEGNFSIVVNGVLMLKSETRAYVIDMPCAIVIGAPCFRIMAIIPGWDEPMHVEGGVYDVNLKLTWSKASGSGKFYAKLHLIHMRR